MMLRRLVLLLLVLNLGVWAWSQGMLQDLGLGPDDEREPERLERQIQPEQLRVNPWVEAAPEPEAPSSPQPESEPLQVVAAASAQEEMAEDPLPAENQAPVTGPDDVDTPEPEPAPEDPAPPPPTPVVLGCLQAGPFDEAQAETLRRGLASWTTGGWQLLDRSVAGRWMVLLSLADAEAVRVRRADLRERGIDVDQPGSAFEPGLSLGRFSTEEAAQQGLIDLASRGVTGLRIVQDRQETTTHVLRLPRADTVQRDRAQLIIGRLGVQRRWVVCD